MNKIYFAGMLFVILGLFSCGDNDAKQSLSQDDRANEIITNSIRAMGGDILDHAEITFDFRDQSLSYYNNKGKYQFTRKFTDTAGLIIKDTLTNEDFIRYKDGKKLDLSSQEKSALQEGVNSIIYFAFLPYRLNDPAVIKEYIDQVSIKGKAYEKVKVTFQQHGGGADHNDVYYYYFDPEDYILDYLSYDFHVNDGGIRFRSGYNERTVKGVIIRDYINYMVDPDSVDYSRIEDYYNDDQMKELSRIELKNINVRDLSKP